MIFDILLTDEAKKHIQFFKKNNKKISQRIIKLIEDISKHPETGIGKPEKLKYEYSGLYSRRITEFHRIIYKIDNDNNSVIILPLYGHYD